MPEEDIEAFHERNNPPRTLSRLTSIAVAPKNLKDMIPPTFKDPNMKLRPYQEDGFRWLVFAYLQKKNVILADEMGLGKTIQSSSVLWYLYKVRNNHGPFLVVAPLVTLEQWRREIETWTTMNCVLFHGSAADREVILENEFYYVDENGKPTSNHFKFNVLITTYELVLAETEMLANIKWEYLVVDEGHRLKNNQVCRRSRDDIYICIHAFLFLPLFVVKSSLRTNGFGLS